MTTLVIATVPLSCYLLKIYTLLLLTNLLLWYFYGAFLSFLELDRYIHNELYKKSCMSILQNFLFIFQLKYRFQNYIFSWTNSKYYITLNIIVHKSPLIASTHKSSCQSLGTERECENTLKVLKHCMYIFVSYRDHKGSYIHIAGRLS